MDIIGVMNDKALKGTKKRAAVIEMIVSGDLNCEQMESIQTNGDHLGNHRHSSGSFCSKV